MKRFALTGPAERDLDQIKSFLLEQAGVAITLKVFQNIRDALKLLGNEPEIRHVREDSQAGP